VNLPPDAQILEAGVLHTPGLAWVASITFKVPGQGGYDRAPSDDMVRAHFETREDAGEWLLTKLRTLSCWCPACLGLGVVDDRGFPLLGQPYFDTVPCPACGRAS
jgi:hypothetical protein